MSVVTTGVRPGDPQEIPGSRAGAVLELIERARESLATGYAAERTTARHLAAGLAAMRAAAALTAALAAPVAGRAGRADTRGPASGGGPRDVWALAAHAAPDLAEWTSHLAAATARRALVEAGTERVGAREADDLLRDAECFVDLVCIRLGMPVRAHHDRLVPARTA